MLTAEALLDRRPSTYEVAERRPLAAVAAIVRFSDEPQWLALEWTDGGAPSMYITPSRDALLTAILDAAQVCYRHVLIASYLFCQAMPKRLLLNFGTSAQFIKWQLFIKLSTLPTYHRPVPCCLTSEPVNLANYSA